MLNDEFKEMLSALLAENVEFLVVGGYAMAAHGYPRATGDIDFWVRPTGANAARVWRSLAKFGAPVSQLTAADFTAPDIFYQIGVPPFRIDFMTTISGVEFDAAWQNRAMLPMDGFSVPVLSQEDMIRNKQASGRPKDLVDVLTLSR